MTELLLLAAREGDRLRVCGTVARDAAHAHGFPHVAVNLIPVRRGKVVLHKRSPHKIVCPNLWDFAGGHVEYSDDYGDLATYDLERASDDAAVREANEEIRCTPRYKFKLRDLPRVGNVGEFETRTPGPQSINVEHSTAYVVRVPFDRVVTMYDTDRFGERKLKTRESTFAALVAEFRSAPESFADGVSRILIRAAKHATLARHLEKAIANATR